jgi:uncharacterized membrane protein
MLAAHISASVGWLGAVTVFLGMSVIGLASNHEPTVRGVYLVMEPAATFILVPLALASFVTGLIQSFVTPWGLFRHYWVLFKLVINVVATTVLILYLATFRAMADIADDRTAGLQSVRNASPVLHAAAALLLLLAATALAVYKPRGLTPVGRRKNVPAGT